MAPLLRHSRVALLLALAALTLHAPAAEAALLDPSFGDGGFVLAPGQAEWISGSGPDPGHRAAHYPGKRLIVGGHSRLGFTVYRYRANGSLDRHFGEEGIATVTLPGEEGEGSFGNVSAVAVQPDGRILVAGLYTPYPPNECEECSPEYQDPREHAAIVRLDPDGGLDLSFGVGRRGHKHEGMRLLRYKSVNDIAVHGGKIFIAGEEVQGAYEFGQVGYVARLGLDGFFDRFGKRHRVVQLPRSSHRSESSSSSVGSIRFDAAGRIYAGGYDRGRFMLARITPRGDIDRRFGKRGFIRTEVGHRGCLCAWASDMTRDRRGRLLISGTVDVGSREKAHYAIAAARYLPNGRLDPSFGRDGIVRTRLAGDAYGGGVAVQPDGRVVVSGSMERKRLYLGLFTVVRYMSDGRRDHSFFGDGVFKGRFIKGGDRAVQPLVDGSGRLIVTGETVVARFSAHRQGGR